MGSKGDDIFHQGVMMNTASKLALAYNYNLKINAAVFKFSSNHR